MLGHLSVKIAWYLLIKKYSKTYLHFMNHVFFSKLYFSFLKIPLYQGMLSNWGCDILIETYLIFILLQGFSNSRTDASDALKEITKIKLFLLKILVSLIFIYGSSEHTSLFLSLARPTWSPIKLQSIDFLCSKYL